MLPLCKKKMMSDFLSVFENSAKVREAEPSRVDRYRPACLIHPNIRSPAHWWPPTLFLFSNLDLPEAVELTSKQNSHQASLHAASESQSMKAKNRSMKIHDQELCASKLEQNWSKLVLEFSPSKLRQKLWAKAW